MRSAAHRHALLPAFLPLLWLASAAQPCFGAHVFGLDPARYHIGDGAYNHTTDYGVVDSNLLTGTHLSVPFRLSGPTTVKVRVEGLWGVGGLYNTPHNNMVLINDIVVGQIRLGASGPWTSGGCQLPAGRHSVLVVSRGPGDRDDFVLERISVVTADPVHVESGGPSRIWSEAARPTASSALGATQADIDAWIRNTSGRWDEMLRERRSREQRQMLIASLGGGSMPETPVAEPPSTYAFDPRMSFAVSRPPEFQENPSAVAIRSARIESESPLHAGGTAPTVLLDCDVDNAFVVRASRPALHWRWVPSGASGSPVGGGPISLGSIDRTDPRFRFSLPLAPPASGAWTLELTLTLGEFGARTQLRVDAES